MTLPPNLLRRLFLFVLGLAICVPPVLIVLAPAVEPGQVAFEPVGYDRIVRDLFVKEGWLKVSEDGRDEVSLIDNFTDVAGPIAVEYYQESSLRRDIALKDPTLWRIDGRVLGVATGAHAVPSPFSQGGWQGNLYLSSNDETLDLVPVGQRQWRIHLATRAAINPNELFEVLSVDACAGPLPVQTAAVVMVEISCGNEKKAVLRIVGHHPYIEATGHWVYVEGHEQPLDPKSGAPLFPGSLIEIRDGNRRVKLQLEGSSGQTMSWQQLLGGRHENKRYERFGRAFERAMDDALEACREGDCPTATEPFTLTLNETLDSEIQSILLRDRKGTGYPAAVTIMDALSGDVLALGSYDPKSPADRKGVVDLQGDAAASPEADRLTINENFEPLSVGSTAKPPVATAIIATPQIASAIAAFVPRANLRDDAPLLQSLVVNNTVELHGKFYYAPDLLGISLTTGAKDDFGLKVTRLDSGAITFDNFIRWSSNLYAASLMLLGAASDIPIPEQPVLPVSRNHPAFSFNGLAQPGRLPTLAFNVGFSNRVPSFYWPNGVSRGNRRTPLWIDRFQSMFGTGPAARDSDGMTDFGIWRGLLARMPDRQMPLLASISPSAHNWDIDGIQDFRADYLPIILGGENYRWTTIKLAEAYSRIVTGKAVRARIVNAAPALDDLIGYTMPMRRNMCRAMTGVLDGTASPIAPDVRGFLGSLDLATGFYAKTGTPQIEVMSPEQQKQFDAENLLIKERILRLVRETSDLTRDHVAIYLNSSAQPAVIPLRKADIARSVEILLANGATRRILGNDRKVAALAAQRMLEFNTLPSEDAASRYSISALDGLVAVPSPVLSNKNRHEAHAFVFVLAIYSDAKAPGTPGMTDCTAKQPLAAYTVAINVQDPRGDARIVARSMLAGGFGNFLRERVRALLAQRTQP